VGCVRNRPLLPLCEVSSGTKVDGHLGKRGPAEEVGVRNSGREGNLLSRGEGTAPEGGSDGPVGRAEKAGPSSIQKCSGESLQGTAMVPVQVTILQKIKETIN